MDSRVYLDTEAIVAIARKTATGKRMEKAAVATGRELGALVGRLEKEARNASRRGSKMEDSARRRSVELLRRASRSLEKLAAQLEKSRA